MSLPITAEMKQLLDKVDPYLNKNLELPDDAPEEIKEILEECRRLAREQEEFELNL
jgi:hypothetical protein